MKELNIKPSTASNVCRKRNDLQLITEILENAKAGITKTRMMYKVGMSHSQLNRYLAFLDESGMIDKDSGVYQTTSKGLMFIQKFKDLNLLFQRSEMIF